MYSYIHRFVKEEYRSISPLVIVKKAHHYKILHRNQNEKKIESKKKKPFLKNFYVLFI